MIEPILLRSNIFLVSSFVEFLENILFVSIDLKISREKNYIRRRKSGTRVYWKKTIADTQVHDFSQGHGGWPETVHIGLVRVH